MKILIYKSFLGYYHNKYYTGGWEDVIYIATSEIYDRKTITGFRKTIKVVSDELDAYREKSWL